MSPRIARRIAAGTAICFALAAGACSSEQQEFAKHLERAQEHQQQGRSKEALSELRSALQIDPGSAEVNYRIAELLAQDKQPADAVFFFRETTRIDPTRSDAALAEAKLILFDDTARAHHAAVHEHVHHVGAHQVEDALVVRHQQQSVVGPAGQVDAV